MALIKNRKFALTLFCIAALYSTWGVVYLSIKFALVSFPPVLLSSIRYMSAGSIFLLWSFFIKKDRALPAKTQFITIFFASCMMIVIGGAFLNISGLYINSGTIALLMGSTPLWMVVVSWFLGYDKKPSASVFAGLIGGFIGVGVLAVSTGILGGSNAVLGIITIFISMAGWVAGSIFLKHRHSDMDMIKSLGFQMVTGGLIMFGISFLTGEWAGFDISEITLKAFLSTLHLIFFFSFIGYTCYVWLLYNTPTHIAISYAYAEPVVAVVVGALFGGEPINRITIFACVFIIISVFFVIRDKK